MVGWNLEFVGVMGRETEKDSVLKKTLKNLCVSNGWSYGVFWGFDQPNSMFLVIEDVYYEDQVRTVIDNMLLQIQMVGEGVIGQAAYNGKHKWIVSNTASGGWNSFRSIEDQLDYSEFQCQFSFGIKTIAVIPVESRGVIQFGSTVKIPERMEFLDLTKRSFQNIKHVLSSETSETYDINRLFASLLSTGNSNNGLISPVSTNGSPFIPDFYNGRPELSLGAMSHFDDLSQNSGTEAHVFLSDDPFEKTSCSTLTSFESQFQSQTRTQDPLDVVLLKPNSFNIKGDSGLASSSFTAQTRLLEEANSSKSSDFLTDAFNTCLIDDLSQLLASSSEQNINEIVNALGDDVSQLMESASTSSGLVGNGTFVDIPKEHPSNSVHSSITNTFSAQKNLYDNECHQEGSLLEDIIRPMMTGICSATSSSLSKCNSELDAKSATSSRKGLFSELGLGELLAGTNGLSSPTKRRRMESSSMHTNQADVNMSFLHCDMEMSNDYLNRKDLFPKSQVGLWIDDSYSITEGSVVLTQPQKSEGQAKAIRKRARSGESPRPRPKDRQQIQDRIKELRGIIPNGGKCSIDSLLERTIKYMLFMQGVTKYADKLKQVDKPKLVGKDNSKFLKDTNTCGGGGGVTRAFEVGSRSMVCPIIVEDLNSPGQMRIEMLCEEQGFFLEIADIIRGFGLNILKGVTEIRENKIWASFIVEARGSVRRIDVFWSLVRLLQETSNKGMDSANQPSNFIDGGVPLLDSYQKSNFPLPNSLAEILS